jgi:hypothetical protein
MKKIFVLTFLVLHFCQTSYSQGNVEVKYQEAVEAYKLNDFDLAVSLIRQIKPLYKNVPPKVLFVEIMAKAQILKADPLNDFLLIDNTRSLTRKYLSENKTRVNDNYHSIQAVSDQLSIYPKDQASFNEKKAQIEREETLKKELQERADADAKARNMKADADAKAKKIKDEEDEKKRMEIVRVQQERDRLQAEKDRQEQAERDRLAQIERAKKQEEQIRIDKLLAVEVEKQRLIQQKKQKRQLKSFASFGFQSGEIAKYGLLYELGGRRAIGFHIAVRTSLTAEEDILKGAVKANKTEIVLGPNIRVSKRFYLNFGGGYGYYDFINRNDYAGTFTIDKTGYLVTSAALMIRINKVININGGVSFMDIDKDFYRPEITFGLTFNLKRKSKK